MSTHHPFDEDGSVVENAAGGLQSDLPTAFHLVPPHALAAVACMLKAGAAKYGAENPWLIPIEDHLNHALRHSFQVVALRRFRAPVREDVIEELTSAACRTLFALEEAIRNVEPTKDLHEKEPSRAGTLAPRSDEWANVGQKNSASIPRD